jgi:sugar transferase (PEP-CTERM/EpsH1 system associated)
MNILFVTPYPPSRIRVRSFELLRALADRNHTITLATLWTTADERQELDALRAVGIRVVDFHLPTTRSLTNALCALPTATPLQANYCWHPRFAKLLVELALETNPDIIHVEHLRGARYGLYLKEKLATANHHTANHPIPIIWDSVDCITHLFRQAATQSQSRKSRWLTKLELGRTSHYEGWLVGQFDRTLVTSATDQAALEQLATTANPTANLSASRSRVELLANGVDLEYFAPQSKPRQAATLIFSGKMSYHANIAAADYLVKEIMPLVWQQRPDVDLWIVGKDPTRGVSELTDTPAIKSGKITGKVVVTGTVPDIRTYLCQATIAVAPLRYGAGIQNKVLEAMACATPVIASPQAAAALHTQVGNDLLVGHTPQEFAQSILSLLASPTQQTRLGQAGRTYVQEHHAWAAAAVRLETIYLDTLQTTQVGHLHPTPARAGAASATRGPSPRLSSPRPG